VGCCVFTMHPDGYSGTHYKSLDSTLGKCTTLTELYMVYSELFEMRVVAFTSMVSSFNFLNERTIWYILLDSRLKELSPSPTSLMY
jgi:hypothetical protein